MTKKYEVAIVGAGPAGYVAAIRCAQLGMSTLCIDDFVGKSGKPALGGTCLNVGCVPSKALLDSSKQFENLNKGLSEHGISHAEPEIDCEVMVNRKDKIVSRLTGGIDQLFKANGVEVTHGRARLLANRVLEITKSDGSDSEQITADHIILAPGSVPFEIPGMPFDGEYIIDNADALNIDSPPQNLGVIGAGVIGLELGSVWRRLGSKVTILEALDDFLGAADRDISRTAAREFKKQGLEIRLGTRVESANVDSGEVKVTYSQADKTESLSFDKLLVAVGRRPNTEGLLADDCGISLGERGEIPVDDDCRTSLENVWAIGDAVRGPMLAHKGSEEGVAVAERIKGQKPHLDFNTVPWVIYTAPEIAWVGKTEQELEADSVSYNVGNFPFVATGRALAMGDTAGMVKILAHTETDRILGVHIVGPSASELLAEAVVAMEFCGSSEDLARIIHAHPTLSEALHEAALAVDKRAIHKVN